MRSKLNRRDIPLDSPFVRRRALAARVVSIADSLDGVVATAVELDLVVPPPIGNLVLDLHSWAARVEDGGGTRSASADATRVLALLRSMPDHQLLALLADLPWSRVDTLLDAAEPAREPRHQPRHQPQDQPRHQPQDQPRDRLDPTPPLAPRANG
jgi:hypothetical protein